MATPSLHQLRLLRAVLMALPLLLTPITVRANLGPPWSGGQIVAEPVGIKDVEITRESLTIDLRPLAKNERVQVEVVYHLHNHGLEKKLALLFASGSPQMADFQVWLGDQPISSQPAEDAPIPTSWQTPKHTPGIHDTRALNYVPWTKAVPIALNVIIPPGEHVLKVRYAAEAAIHRYGEPTVYRQFAYVLAPARSWSGFGGLNVSIYLPADWRAACTPALARDGDKLTGTFADLPADAIALTVQAPEGWAYRLVSFGSQVLLALAALGGMLLCWQVGRANGRRLALPTASHPNWLQQHAWPSSLGAGVVWGMMVLGAGLLTTLGPEWVLPPGQVSHYGYGQVFAIYGLCFLSVLVVPVGFLIAHLNTVVTRNRTALAQHEGVAHVPGR
jgi:hypothetical protein